MVLTELRDKAEQGEKIAMVWPAPGTPGANPPRGRRAGGRDRGDPAAEEEGRARRTVFCDPDRLVLHSAGRGPPDGDRTRPRRRGRRSRPWSCSPPCIGIGGLIVYLVWPPGQEYLYKHAEALMASTHRADWITARDEYLEPLDRRFPDNPYREQTARWRDRILLDEAERAPSYLVAPVKTQFGEPNNDAERHFVVANAVAAEASARGDDLGAVAAVEGAGGAAPPR